MGVLVGADVGAGAVVPVDPADDGPHPAAARPISAATAARGSVSSRRCCGAPQCGHAVSVRFRWHAQRGQERSELDMRPSVAGRGRAPRDFGVLRIR
jgi:hypothetical protein